ncbi:MAG: hypothetical protein QOK49_136, partial [Baekduia sp.]|nr:hypothetical protein [Baekduia sp.]
MGVVAVRARRWWSGLGCRGAARRGSGAPPPVPPAGSAPAAQKPLPMPTPARCRHLPALASILLAALAAAPGPAGARVALIATGTPDVALLDVATGRVIRRLPLPGPTTAVAVSPDGRTAFAAGGGVVVALDLRDPATITPQVSAPAPGALAAFVRAPGARAAATPAPQTVAGGAPVRARAVSPGGARVYGVAGRRLVVL